MRRAMFLALAGTAALAATPSDPPLPPDQEAQVRIYNTVMEKLARGERVVGATVTTPDPEIYCAMADAGFDFLWIEMQHSPLTYQEVARMIWACRDSEAVPFIRVPDATEGDIQKATDIGALGIIIPMVDDLEKIQNAVTFAKYPPQGRRSQGNGQYGALYGSDYRRTANDNIMIVALIENPAGVRITPQIAGLPGVDVVYVASTDLGSFSGLRQGDPAYESLVSVIHDETLAGAKTLGGPLAWMNTRAGYRFFQGPTAASLIATGARIVLDEADPCKDVAPGVAPIEGEPPCLEK